MTSPHGLNRRTFLQGALSAVAGVAIVQGCSSSPPYADASLSQPALLTSLGEDRVRQIGRAYLQATPTESTRATLREAIVRSARQQRGVPWSQWPSLDALITSDFSDDRIVFPDGWMLAVNEARQCALFALQA